jgi:hypothetical protein
MGKACEGPSPKRGDPYFHPTNKCLVRCVCPLYAHLYACVYSWLHVCTSYKQVSCEVCMPTISSRMCMCVFMVACMYILQTSVLGGVYAQNMCTYVLFLYMYGHVYTSYKKVSCEVCMAKICSGMCMHVYSLMYMHVYIQVCLWVCV